jgi:outer membrane biosynthesis protein TonB
MNSFLINERERNGRWLLFGTIASLLLLFFLLIIIPTLIPRADRMDEPVEELALQVFLEENNQVQGEPRQVVSIDEPETAEIPEEADYEDRVNRQVEEETVARDSGSDPWVGQIEGVVEQPENPDPEAEETEETETNPNVLSLVVEQDDTDRSMQESEEQETEDFDPIQLGFLNPTLENAGDFIAVPGARRVDYLDLPEGDRTQLNSIENLYWSFWDRIKTQVRPFWRPTRIYRQRDPTGRVFGVEDRYTVLRVTLNGDGSLRHIYLERSSDLDFLDREAMLAIQEAGPFNNVPEGLKDDNGLMSFRFGFYFEVSSTEFRIRREDW